MWNPSVTSFDFQSRRPVPLLNQERGGSQKRKQNFVTTQSQYESPNAAEKNKIEQKRAIAN